jgi:hypothetical protein
MPKAKKIAPANYNRKHIPPTNKFAIENKLNRLDKKIFYRFTAM